MKKRTLLTYGFYEFCLHVHKGLILLSNLLKRVAAIHDISCFGKCSLTVALPVISSAGVEVSVIPTAMLSTQTGGIDGYTFHDLTDDIVPVADHWKSLGLKFDAVYTGFLGSFQQIAVVSDVTDKLSGEDTMIIVDPVLGDCGELYSVFDERFPAEMKKLCMKADVIVPNMTEAFLLLSMPYVKGPYDFDFVSDLMKKLSELGPEKIVLTGVESENDLIGTSFFDKKTGECQSYMKKRINDRFHGSGDVFASVLTACLVKGLNLKDSAKIASDFTYDCLIRTKKAGTDLRFGVNFEDGLHCLYNIINNHDNNT